MRAIKAREMIVAAAVAWALESPHCHLCDRGMNTEAPDQHDPDCPVDALIKRQLGQDDPDDVAEQEAASRPRNDPDTYAAMSVPHETVEGFTLALRGFEADMREVRKKHRIKNVVYILSGAVIGHEDPITYGHMGDSRIVWPLVAMVHGRLRADELARLEDASRLHTVARTQEIAEQRRAEDQAAGAEQEGL